MGVSKGGEAQLSPFGCPRGFIPRGQYYLTRMQYLERENRAMNSLLEAQAEQLSKLKLEMVRLKEFEDSLRQVSGLSVRPELQEKEPGPGRAALVGKVEPVGSDRVTTVEVRGEPDLAHHTDVGQSLGGHGRTLPGVGGPQSGREGGEGREEDQSSGSPRKT